MLLQTAYRKYYELLKKGIEDGLNHLDYKEVLSLSKQHFENDMYKKYWVSLMGDVNYLLEDLKMDSKLTCEIDPDCMEYILNNCYLLPLVLTNTRAKDVKPFQEGSYLFLCQFHEDEYPAMQVLDYNNTYKCLACGERGNIISYLKKIEGIKKDKNIIDLLRCIYNLDNVSLSQKLFDISTRYYHTIISDQYKRLLERGYTLFRSNNILSIDGHFIDKMYEDRFYLIHRLECNERDPYFEYKPNDTYKLKLSKEEYEPFMESVSKKI